MRPQSSEFLVGKLKGVSFAETVGIPLYLLVEAFGFDAEHLGEIGIGNDVPTTDLEDRVGRRSRNWLF